MLDYALAFNLIVAALVGLAVGTEREWSGHSSGPDARFAGIRTFGLLGVLGGLSGWFYRSGFLSASVGVLIVTMLFPTVAYAVTTRRVGATPDGTTEVAAMLVAVLGFTSGIGERSIASAVAVVVVVLLAEKSSLQRMLKRADEVELRAAVQFAVLALIVLPLLPDREFGPFNAIRPRALWTVVLIYSAMNFAGYLARRLIGDSRGLVVTGLLGGLVSSTAIAFNFSRRSREDRALGAPMAVGVIAACTVLLPRVALVSAVLRPTLAIALLPLLLPPFLAGAALVGRDLWRQRLSTGEGAASAPIRNPLGLVASLQMALAFQVVLIVIAFMQQRIGSTGVLVSATILGLTDMDALTVAMTRLAIDPSLTLIAARAIGIGVLSNTFLKTLITVVLGAPGFRVRAASGLTTLGVASAIGLWASWRFADSIAEWFPWR